MLAEPIVKMDKRALKAKMEAVFHKWRLLKYHTFEEREAKITASYERREWGQTNRTSDQTADIAAYNVDQQAARKEFIERVEHAVSRLPEKERELIEIRYMDRDSQYLIDRTVYDFKLSEPISAVTYANIRHSAFEKLFMMLQDILGE